MHFKVKIFSIKPRHTEKNLKKSWKNLGTFSYIIDIFNIVWWNRKIWIAIKRKIPALNRGRRDVANGAPGAF